MQPYVALFAIFLKLFPENLPSQFKFASCSNLMSQNIEKRRHFPLNARRSYNSSSSAHTCGCKTMKSHLCNEPLLLRGGEANFLDMLPLGCAWWIIACKNNFVTANRGKHLLCFSPWLPFQNFFQQFLLCRNICFETNDSPSLNAVR